MSGHNVNVCDIGDDVKEVLKKFRFQKHSSNSALILKVNRQKQALEVDEELENVDLEELQDILPSHQPRFIVYSFKMDHEDGRASFPLCFIFYTPRDAHMELQVMYAGTQRALAATVGAPRLLEVREIDELTNDWLKEKLAR
ncbi:glia maturation factor beta [Pectinophora gossypiella]|uniref:ADF-H domain-containing protein n=1 Tax=Pectinophora gossypiella TaxID=13191 RepID=A0A1E1VZ42_PECGO|nr:glia maturation factor beta [Pectinophora gossypiella]